MYDFLILLNFHTLSSPEQQVILCEAIQIKFEIIQVATYHKNTGSVLQMKSFYSKY